MLPLDVTASQAERHAEMVRRLKPHEKARIVFSMIDAGKQLALAGVRHRNPQATEALIRWLVTELLYGEIQANRLYGPRPAR